jgi:hypothetical protein
VIKLYLYQLIFIYVVLSFQFNLYDYGYALKIIFGCLALLIVLTKIRYVQFYIIFSILCLVLFYFDIKYIISLAFLFFGFIYANLYGMKKNIIFDFLIFINVSIMFLQLTGEFKIFSEFQDYYIAENLSIFESNDWFPLFQIRPSGIFPNTIYLSYFLLLSTAYAMNIRAIKKYILLYLLLALSLIISGSSLGILLSLMIILLNLNLFLSIYILSFLFLYFLILPDYFSTYNYSLDNLILSIQSRLSPNLDGSFNSLISKNIIFFGIITVLVLIYLLIKKIYNNYSLFFYIIILFTPLILHDFGFNIAYAFFFGYISNIIIRIINPTPVNPYKFFYI